LEGKINFNTPGKIIIQNGKDRKVITNRRKGNGNEAKKHAYNQPPASLISLPLAQPTNFPPQPN